MKKKGTWMRASAGALSAAMVLGSVTVAPAVKAENVEEKAGYEVNYALNSKVTASNQELANQWGPEKAVDGIVNRDAEKPEQSRWSTAQSTTQEARTLTLDLGAVKTFSQFVIEWERTNITNFKISVSDTEDGTYKDVYVKEDGQAPAEPTPRPELPNAVPEDVQQVVKNFRPIADEASGMLRTYLKKARLSLAGDNRLMIVMPDALGADFVGREDRRKELESLIENRIGKKVEVEVRHVEEGRRFEDTFVDIEKKINMEIIVED